MSMVPRSRVLVALLACACAVAPPAPATEEDVDQLEPAALAGHREAVRGLFELRMRALSDGAAAVAEGIDMVLGKCARMCPQTFLEELAHSGDFWRLDALLGNCGPELVDMFEAQAAELSARRDALLTVHRASLRKTRDACVSQLQRSIEHRSQWP